MAGGTLGGVNRFAADSGAAVRRCGSTRLHGGPTAFGGERKHIGSEAGDLIRAVSAIEPDHGRAGFPVRDAAFNASGGLVETAQAGTGTRPGAVFSVTEDAAGGEEFLSLGDLVPLCARGRRLLGSARGINHGSR